jgi:hypothetical protein
MKSIALFILAFFSSVFIVLVIYSDDIGKTQVDYQGYQRIQNMLEGIDK